MNQLENYPYGTVLKIQREYSIDDIFKLMDDIKNIGMNYIVIWPAIYWWEDKSYKDYPYHTGHEILKYAQKIDIKIIMELTGQLTSLEYVPDFAVKDEYYPLNENGSVNMHNNAYGYLNYNHPEVNSMIKEGISKTVEQYKDYESLYGYDVWNETMFSSYDKFTWRVFRNWLKQKYETIDNLNSIWDRTYYDWEDIKYTTWLWASVMPMVDYNQFKKENVGFFLKEWSHEIRKIDTKKHIIADNISSMTVQEHTYQRPQDDWNLADNVQHIGVSMYPKNSPKAMDIDARWQVYKATSCCSRDRTFWVSEMQSHHRSMFDSYSTLRSDDIRLWNFEAISHGAKGIIFWKWGPFIKGIQTFARGLVDSQYKYTKRSEEAAKIAKIIKKNEKEFISFLPKKAKVAILFDTLSLDFIKVFTKGVSPKYLQTHYTSAISSIYRCLWKNNVSADFIRPKDIFNNNIDDYKVLFITSQVNLSEELLLRLKEFVQNGKTVISDGKFGLIKDNGLMHKIIPGGKKSRFLGYNFMDVEYCLKDTIEIQSRDKETLQMPAFYERQIFNIFDEKVVNVTATYLDGKPAILESKVGLGKFVHIGTLLWLGYSENQDKSLEKFISSIVDNYNLRSYSCEDSQQFKINVLEGKASSMVFIFNYADKLRKSKIKLFLEEDSSVEIVDIISDERIEYTKKDNIIEIDVKVMKNNVRIFKMNSLLE